jgi:creatinine amidohydrolase|uniref:Creatininase family protein n=1 Tax=Desulfobacca acetoxidans TaxID=60893 RepID=A0A7V6A4C3_9BACT
MPYWEKLNMPEFEAWREKHRTVILPVGSLEEHGPHLPLGTDTFHALEVARRAAALRPVLIAPPIFYGLCRSTREHPGTVSLTGDTLRRLVLDIGREFYRNGLKNLVILSGHAGGTHMAALVEAGEELLADYADLRVAICNILDLLREVLAQNPEMVHTKGDSHAGEVETALMLAAFPQLVKGRAPAEWPSFPKYVLVRDKRRYWPGGVWGDPGPATPEQGEALLQAEADRLVHLLDFLSQETQTFS